MKEVAGMAIFHAREMERENFFVGTLADTIFLVDTSMT